MSLKCFARIAALKLSSHQRRRDRPAKPDRLDQESFAAQNSWTLARIFEAVPVAGSNRYDGKIDDAVNRMLAFCHELIVA